MDKSSLSESQIETLIKMVEERPCIWDKTCNKDSAKKNSAWMEIFEHFSDGTWDDMSPNDRKQMELELTAKWTNLRDTFTKLVKKGREKKYRHYNQMKFLAKNIEVDLVHSSSDELDGSRRASPVPNGNNALVPALRLERIKKTSPSMRIQLNKKLKRLAFTSKTVRRPKLRATRPRTSTPVVSAPPPHDHVANNSNPTPQPNHKRNMNTLDEDEAFFISIMPSVKKLASMNKLEFRIGVLDILRTIAHSES